MLNYCCCEAYLFTGKSFEMSNARHEIQPRVNVMGNLSVPLFSRFAAQFSFDSGGICGFNHH